ncbi:hypothetical protein IFM89_010062 [Coptis chinensis]|uniref:Phytocyanin domain-containing protein n=1 Tax=Coptis chinensis TaxID=261450 RepID=A0A835HKE7_9MAGN|nr:hypothetical protein IFM89_010062 [Coptis chinensis]
MASSCSLLSSVMLLFIIIFFSFSEANEILVGGKTDSWKIPSSQSQTLNKWAEKCRFNIEDTLVMQFDPKKDSVLQVNKTDYVTCNTSNPIVVYRNETVMIVLLRSGPFYFISGAKGHCQQGQKMTVVVLSDIHTYKGSSPAVAPSPVVSRGGPAIAPSPVVFGDGPAVSPSPVVFHVAPAVARTGAVSGLRSSVFNGPLFLAFGSLLLEMVF